jgi:leucyl aminopeptidase (aminopeptidase T)
MGKNIGFIEKVSLLSKIDIAISIIINKNLAVKRDERLAIVYDHSKSKLAKRFETVASMYIDNVEMVKIKSSKVNGQEPSAKDAKIFLEHDVLILLTSRSLSHTKARRKCTDKGIRIASMPGITSSVLRRSIDIDYDRLKDEIKKLGRILNRGKKIRVFTKLGTDIEFGIDKRKAHGMSAGIYNRKGRWGNLPEGEVFIAPVEGSATGHFVVDGSIAGFGKMQHPLIFFVEEGRVIRVTDGKKPPKIEEMLDKFGSKARNIAEFGIGLNKKAKISGIVLEDEKAYGSCHIALGNNIGFGGKTDVPLHIDCVIMKPDIYVDNKIVISKGKLKI